MSIPDLKILVTGNAGYLGSILTERLLNAGHRVVGVDSLKYGNSGLSHVLGRENFSFVKQDVRDIPEMRKLVAMADVVIPLAALVGAPLCDRNEREAWEVNRDSVVGLMNLLSPKQRVLWTNSNSAYGHTSGEEEVNEASPFNPLSVYSRSKCEAEKAVLDFGGVSYRLATAMGVSPRMRLDLLLNTFVDDLLAIKEEQEKGRFLDFVLYEPHFNRNFVHVRDVAEVFTKACDPAYQSFAKPEGVYNLGNPEANTTKFELATLVCHELGVDSSCIRISDEKDPDQRNYKVSNGRLLEWSKKVGFKFRYGLRRTIREVAQFCSTVGDEWEGMRNF